MACHVQSALSRTVWTICGLILIQLAWVAHAQETIPIWRAGISHSVTVSKFTDADQNDWLELAFPLGTSLVRILPSDHYAWLGGRIVGFKNRWSKLSVQRAMPISAFTIEEPPEGSVIIFEPERAEIPDGALVFLDWDAILGVRTTAAMSSQLKRNAQITNFVSSAEGVEIKVLTYMKERGSLKFNNALEISEVRLENERVPVFRPRIPNTREEQWTHFVGEEWIEAADGQRLKLWIAGISDTEIAAKAFLNGQEITWIGGRDPKWLFDGVRLIGASDYEEKTVLIGEGIPTALQTESAPVAKAHQRHPTPVNIRVDLLAAELGLTREGSMYVRSVKKEGADLVIPFSGVMEAKDIPEIRYNPSAGTATVRADGWEVPVTVEPFASSSVK